MAAKKSAKKPAKQKSARQAATSARTQKSDEVFTAEERAAMREYVRERKRARSGGVDESGEVLAKIAAMAPEDRALAERVHALIMSAAPFLAPRLWYGMPAYAKDGKVVCFFQDAKKFKARYATLGFSDQAALDDGQMWPTSFALKPLGPTEEARITALVKRAVS